MTKSPVLRRVFVENCPSNARIFVILPVYFDFGHVQSVIELSGQQDSERALNHKEMTSNARNFVQKKAVFRPPFYKKELISNTGGANCISDVVFPIIQNSSENTKTQVLELGLRD